MAVIPSGTSEPWFWAAREAAANDALARLFYSLAEKNLDRQYREAREDRRDARYDQRLQQRETLQDKRLEAAEERQNRRLESTQEHARQQQQRAFEQQRKMEEERYRRQQQQRRPAEPNVLGPGAAAPSVGPSSAPSSNAPATIPGSVAPAPSPDKFSQDDSGPASAGAQALAAMFTDTGDDGEINVSAASKKPPDPNKPFTPKTTTTTTAKPAQLPSQSVSKTRPSAAYVPIDEKVLNYWHDLETKYKLPPNTLLTTMGFENAGGRRMTPDRNSGATAAGLFMFPKALRDHYGIKDSDINNPYIMGEWAARNMRYNADTYNKMTQTKDGPKIPALGAEPENVMDYTILHRFGPYDGPRIIAASRLNPDAPLKDVLFKAPGRNTFNDVVTHYNLPSNVTVRGALGDHAKIVMPWQHEGIKLKAAEPQETKIDTEPTTTAPTTTEEQPAVVKPQSSVAPQGGGAGSAVDFLQSRAGSNVRLAGLTPLAADRLANAIQRAEAATGDKVSIISGVRSNEQQAQLRANYIQRPVKYGGQMYYPNAKGGLAARPGQSRHRAGQGALDIKGDKAIAWIKSHGDELDLSFVRGDHPHIQLGRIKDPKQQLFQQQPTQVAKTEELSAQKVQTDASGNPIVAPTEKPPEIVNPAAAGPPYVKPSVAGSDPQLATDFTTADERIKTGRSIATGDVFFNPDTAKPDVFANTQAPEAPESKIDVPVPTPPQDPIEFSKPQPPQDDATGVGAWLNSVYKRSIFGKPLVAGQPTDEATDQKFPTDWLGNVTVPMPQPRPSADLAPIKPKAIPTITVTPTGAEVPGNVQPPMKGDPAFIPPATGAQKPPLGIDLNQPMVDPTKPMPPAPGPGAAPPQFQKLPDGTYKRISALVPDPFMTDPNAEAMLAGLDPSMFDEYTDAAG